MNNKPFLAFPPLEVVRSNGATFTVGAAYWNRRIDENNFNPNLRHKPSVWKKLDTDIVIHADNWPTNLIYNPALLQSDYMFYEQFCSDSTFYFYTKSAIRMCESLIYQALVDSNINWEHGPISILYVDGKCSSPYMIKTRTEIAAREMHE